MKWRQDTDQDDDETQAAALQHERALAAVAVAYRTSPQNFALPASYLQHEPRPRLQNDDRHLFAFVPAAIAGSAPGHAATFQGRPGDLTEQIRISVQDTHISQRASYFSDSGGNVSDVHESSAEEDQGSPTYGNIEHTQPSQYEYHYHHHHHHHLQHQHQPQAQVHHQHNSNSNRHQHQHHHYSHNPANHPHQHDHSSHDLVRRIQQTIDNHAYQQEASLPESISPQPSTSTSASPEHHRHGASRVPATSLMVLDDDAEGLQTRDSGVALGDETGHATGVEAGAPACAFEEIRPIYIKLRGQRINIAHHRQRQINDDDDDDDTSVKKKREEEERSAHSDTAGFTDSAEREPADERAGANESERSPETTAHYTIPAYTHNPQVGVIKNYLFNGSTFRGYQKSRLEKYEVNVQIQHVDYENSYLYGYLNIAHLTESHPSLTTFFEGEIISHRHPFLTRKWEATDQIDLEHWCKFDDFARNHASSFNSQQFDYDKLKHSDYIYMRWKERFLVPDHTVKKVHGASYEGFYYTCYSKRSSRIKGYYFHIEERIESFQSLDLSLENRERNSQVYEFR